ncbi:transcriptional regulator MraZ [Thiosulfatimonas sediminis]|uniref:Transcriptional regulator MraZ n=1 Tax=Thiosulfatimonas sediminis TaxID=2675054 RepID=A0A6F8PWN0_9GAMM|nr:transcriptional regulator MraZ [Thiosulfatimonas sediminis]
MNIDAKGRIAIPKKYRDYLQDEHESTLYVSFDTANECLNIYPQKQWLQFEAKLMSLPNTNPTIRKMQRLMIGRVNEQILDIQGRINVGPQHIERMGFSKEVILVGQGKRFELWDKAIWDQDGEESLNAEELQQLGELLPDFSF